MTQIKEQLEKEDKEYSKYVQIEKIKAQIEILYEFRDYVESSTIFNERIFTLQQQLKYLE
jgi:hypothetical protein